MTPVSNDVKTDWFYVIHDIIPTQDRPHAIHLAPSNLCQMCTVPDTLSHRMTACGERKEQWIWTRKRLAMFLRIDQRYVNEEWIYRPHFRLWPKQKHLAVLWVLACFITFGTHKGNRLTSLDYHDFL